MPGAIDTLAALGIHRTDVYRYARGAVIPNAERASQIEKATEGGVKANGWIPDDAAVDDPPALKDDPPTSPDNPVAIAEDPPPASTAEPKGAKAS